MINDDNGRVSVARHLIACSTASTPWYLEALEILRFASSHLDAHYLTAVCLEKVGDLGAARAHLESSEGTLDGRSLVLLATVVEAVDAQDPQATELVAEVQRRLEAGDPSTMVAIAQGAAQRGHAERAMALIDGAAAEGFMPASELSLWTSATADLAAAEVRARDLADLGSGRACRLLAELIPEERRLWLERGVQLGDLYSAIWLRSIAISNHDDGEASELTRVVLDWGLPSVLIDMEAAVYRHGLLMQTETPLDSGAKAAAQGDELAALRFWRLGIDSGDAACQPHLGRLIETIAQPRDPVWVPIGRQFATASAVTLREPSSAKVQPRTGLLEHVAESYSGLVPLAEEPLAEHLSALLGQYSVSADSAAAVHLTARRGSSPPVEISFPRPKSGVPRTVRVSTLLLTSVPDGMEAPWSGRVTWQGRPDLTIELTACQQIMISALLEVAIAESGWMAPQLSNQWAAVGAADTIRNPRLKQYVRPAGSVVGVTCGFDVAEDGAGRERDAAVLAAVRALFDLHDATQAAFTSSPDTFAEFLPGIPQACVADHWQLVAGWSQPQEEDSDDFAAARNPAPASGNRVFRVFLSSTFADFAMEREALQKKVWPELDAFARSRGARFEVVDLRWGISEEAQREHSTMEICLDELARAQRLSPRPNFVALLGQRYGWEPVAPSISAGLFENMMQVASSGARNALTTCYQLDMNALPEGRWVLRPQEEWRTAKNRISESRLLKTVRDLVLKLDLSADERAGFFRSATHQEIARGALASPESRDHVRVYIRTITDLDALSDAAVYCDHSEGRVLDADRTGPLAHLVEQFLQPDEGWMARTYPVTWASEPSREAYLERLAADVFADQLDLIERELAHPAPGLLEQRERAQWEFAESRASVIVGRDSELDRIRAYVGDVGEVASPLFVTGLGGSGKSTLLAAAALAARRDHGSATVCVRFVGAVPGAESLGGLIDGLVGDASSQRLAAHSGPGQAMEEHRRDFAQFMESGTKESPVLLFLDSVENLGLADWAQGFDWIPDPLPPYARLVIGVRDASIPSSLMRGLPNAPRVEVRGLTAQDGSQALEQMLALRRRTVTPEQMAAAIDSFQRTGSPLWLLLASDVLSRIRSFDPVPRMAGTVDGLFNRLLCDLAEEARHGDALVRRSLGLLVTSRQGLSEDEVARALGNDRGVHEEFTTRSRQTWNEETLPPIVWARLRRDLEPFLTEQYVDGTLVLQLLHRDLANVVRDRFLSPLHDEDLLAHGALAHSFAPTFARDNWYHVLPWRQQDARALRSFNQQDWHLDSAWPIITRTRAGQWKCDPSVMEKLKSDPTASVWSDGDRALGREAVARDDLFSRVAMGAFPEGWPPEVSFLADRTVTAELAFAVACGFATLRDARASWVDHPDVESAVWARGLRAADAGDPDRANLAWMTLASKGDARAMMSLAVLASAAASANPWFERAARAGDPDAIVTMATACQKGGDLQGARAWLEAAAQQGDPAKMYRLGLLCWEMHDMASCRHWLRLSAEGGNPGAMNDLGELTYTGGDEEGALEWIERAAAAGNTRSMTTLGDIRMSVGDQEGGRYWYERASFRGEAPPMFKLGEMMRDAGGTVVAEQWYAGAAAAGHALAMTRLGELAWAAYRDEIAETWWRRAAMCGDAAGMRHLGECAVQAGDRDAARKWWTQAADAGLASAMYLVGALEDEDGRQELAKQWWVKAAEAGDPRAPIALARHGDAPGSDMETTSLGDGARADTVRGDRDVNTLGLLGQMDATPKLGTVATPEQRAAADAGDPAAMMAIGEIELAAGDRETADMWFERAAMKGRPAGMRRLADRLRERGELTSAVGWWERAASVGDPMSMTSLGDVAFDLDDAEGARAWWTRAAGLGQADARERLSRIREVRVMGVELEPNAAAGEPIGSLLRGGKEAMNSGDVKRAMSAWQQAAQAGSASAAYNLGVLMLIGGATEAAAAWLHAASEAGVEAAAITLMLMGVEAEGRAQTRDLLLGAAAMGDVYSLFLLGKQTADAGDEEGASTYYSMAANSWLV